MISKHISYREGVYSTTATRLGINNTPNDEQLEIALSQNEETLGDY